MNSIRKHLSYANVVATLALVFAMGGSAIAAKHYLITSTKQIKPSVLKRLKAPGRTGRQGLSGIPGPQGTAGAAGAKGADGLSALSALSSGQTESGDYGASGYTMKGLEFGEGVTFPIPLKAAIDAAHVVYTPEGGSLPHCPGPGHADASYLCLYSSEANHVSAPSELNNESTSVALGSGRLGLSIVWISTETGEAFDLGTYTVTAP